MIGRAGYGASLEGMVCPKLYLTLLFGNISTHSGHILTTHVMLGLPRIRPSMVYLFLQRRTVMAVCRYPSFLGKSFPDALALVNHTPVLSMLMAPTLVAQLPKLIFLKLR